MISFKSMLFSIAITLIAYGLFPLVFAKVRKKAITKKAYYLACYGFNFVIMIYFAIFNNNYNAPYPYFLWTSVFAWMGKLILKEKYILVANREEICPQCKKPLNLQKDGLLKCMACGHISKATTRKESVKIKIGDVSVPMLSGWVCVCGRVHPKYESSCVCGKSKADAINQPKHNVSGGETDKTPVNTSQTATDQIRFCRKCGKERTDNGRFCSNCGTEMLKE